MSTGVDVVVEARSYLGVRWLHQGRSRDGLDCAGLVVAIGTACRGLDCPLPDYPRATRDEQMLELAGQHLVAIDKAHMRPGDVVVLAFEKQRHMGLLGDYLYGGLSLIHAYLPPRKVVEQRLDEVWAARIKQAFRFPEIA